MSVVVPAHNAARFVGDALASVLAQTHAPVELVVVDDGSTDGTADAARRAAPSATIVEQPQSGAAVARNTGVERSSGRWIAFLDADDVWIPTKLERQLATLTDAPDAEAAFCLVEEFLDRPEGTPGPQPRPGAHAVRLPSAVLIDRAAFERTGGFDPATAGYDAMDWAARADHAGVRFVCVDEVLVRRRIHASNTGVRDQEAQRQGYVRSLKAALDRRRAAGESGS